MSASRFSDFLTAEITRLDDLVNELACRNKSKIDHPQLEDPGLAIIASRTHAYRRELLAEIANRILVERAFRKNQQSNPHLLIFPNQNPQVFIRQMLASLSKLNFKVVDECAFEDSDWPSLTSGVNLIGIHEGTVSEFETWLSWEVAPVCMGDLLSKVRSATPGTTIVLENYHQVQGVLEYPNAISQLRCAAISSGSFLYIGGGLSHWHEVRERGGVYLSDLADSLTEAVHIADIITILAPEKSKCAAIVYDSRYDAPFKGDLANLL